MESLDLIVFSLTPLHLLVVFGHIVGTNGTQEADVIVRMELGHLVGSCFVRSLQLFIRFIFLDSHSVYQ